MFRKLFVTAGLVLAALSVWAAEIAPTDGMATEAQVVETLDLEADARLAAELQVPILVMFAQQGCAYCEIVEDEFLRPMLISGDYDNRVLIRRVMLDGFDSIRDFNGEMVGVDDLSMRYRAPMTPTVVFLNPQGREVAPRLIGVTTLDFYGGELDERIDAGIKRIRVPQVARQ